MPPSMVFLAPGVTNRLSGEKGRQGADSAGARSKRLPGIAPFYTSSPFTVARGGPRHAHPCCSAGQYESFTSSPGAAPHAPAGQQWTPVEPRSGCRAHVRTWRSLSVTCSDTRHVPGGTAVPSEGSPPEQTRVSRVYSRSPGVGGASVKGPKAQASHLRDSCPRRPGHGPREHLQHRWC